MIIGLILIFAIVVGLIMVAYDDNIAFAIPKKLLCKMGRHKIRVKFGKIKINKWRCQYCKEARKHPELKVVNGGLKF